MMLTKFRFYTLVTALSLAGIGTWLVAPTRAQGGMSGDWLSHNYDLHNSRFSPLDQINTSNASELTQQWSIETGGADALPQVTPLVVDGVMYYNAGSKLFAVNAATGASLWTYQVNPPFPGTGRGPSYGDGRIYAYGGTYGGNVLYAIDAKTGQPVQSFGSKVVFMDDTPRPIVSIPDCLAENSRDIQKCDVQDKPSKWAYHRSQRKAAAAGAGATVIDPIPWLCASDVCPPVVGNVAGSSTSRSRHLSTR